ncbi:hypothetical protein SDC9_153005 [bioreactor metagenome]|uniref:Uncharacterized protein n=1 Tax=bioreactor metagenome TaxID=1076179 RepID=A0A645EWZ6_9ZZZZ
MFGNNIIQFRLCKTRFVTFIMTVLTVREQIDKNINIEFLTKFQCQLRDINHSFYIIPVHVEYG